MVFKILQNKIQSDRSFQKPSKTNEKAAFQGQNLQLKNVSRDEVSFGAKINFKHPFDFKKFEGIQKGIPVFEGVSLPEIFFIGRNFNYVPLQRGCRNLCSHCFLSAEIPKKPTADTISSILWEDLTSLTSGIKELRTRLPQDFLSYETEHHHVNMFLDSEQMVAKVFDQKGMPHNVAEASKEAYSATGAPFLVDTAGWNKKDKWTQNAADELAEFFVKTPEALHQGRVNVSLNPFHSILEKNTELKKTSPQKSQKLREIYVGRIVNALKTFLECGAQLNIRIMPWGARSVKFQTELNHNVLWNFRQKVEMPKSDKNLLEKYNDILILLQENHCYNIVPVGRGASFFDQKHADTIRERFLVPLNDNMTVKQNFYDVFFDMPKTVDINGKVYAGNSIYKQDTGIQLNFINRDKKTAVIHNCFENNMRFYNPPQD